MKYLYIAVITLLLALLVAGGTACGSLVAACNTRT
jgi:hypothetical protein